MNHTYLDFAVSIGKLNRKILKNIQGILKEQRILGINNAQILLLREMTLMKNITPQKVADEGVYMVEHVLFNLKNLDKNEMVDSNVDLSVPLNTTIKINKESDKILDKIEEYLKVYFKNIKNFKEVEHDVNSLICNL
jgi:hypothetical protein